MFSGFSPQTIDFLWGIRMNNNREWFMQHKQEYIQYLYEPMKALGQAVFAPFLERPGNLLKVSRIYRDARMHPPEPYKQSIWLCIRRDVDWWGQHPCMYFEITPEGGSYGFFLWQPTTAYMEAFRRRIAARPDEFIHLIEASQRAVQTEITAQCYKRPKPTDNKALEPYYAWRNTIGCTREIPPGDELFGPALQETVGDFFGKLIPLYEYFYAISEE